MKYSKILILFFLLYNTLSANAQSVKSIQTTLNSWNDDPGDLRYSYYEDPKTGNYVKHGKYAFNLVHGNYYKEAANGNFKNGKRDGAWLYRITRLDDLAFDVNWTGTIQLNFGYKEGEPNGLWIYENKQKYRTSRRGVWLPYEYYFAPNESLTVMFSNGHPSGVYSFLDNSLNNKASINGQFNTKGFINGVWSFNYKEEKKELTFNNGVLIKSITRSMPNGNITYSFERSPDELKYISSLIAGTLKPEERKKNRISVDTFYANEYIDLDARKTLYNKYFNWGQIEGDDLYENNGGSNLGGFAIKLQIKPQLDLEKISEFNELKNVYTKYDYSKSYDTISLNKDFDDFIENYAISLTDDDYNKALEYKKEFIAIIIRRVDSIALEKRRQYLLSEFPFLRKMKLTNETNPIYAEFENKKGLYNQFKIRSEYNVEYKKAKPEVDSIWNENVLSVYCDSNRVVKINEASKLLFEDKFSNLHPQVQPIIKAIVASYYLPALDSLKNKKDFCEANKLVEDFQILLKKVFIWDKNVSQDLSRKHYYRVTNVYAPKVEIKDYKTPVFTKMDDLKNMEELIALLMSLEPDEY
jgi:hypothetical protein